EKAFQLFEILLSGLDIEEEGLAFPDGQEGNWNGILPVGWSDWRDRLVSVITLVMGSGAVNFQLWPLGGERSVEDGCTGPERCAGNYLSSETPIEIPSPEVSADFLSVELSLLHQPRGRAEQALDTRPWQIGAAGEPVEEEAGRDRARETQ